MTISNFRAAEPLYIVIVRDRNAEQQLKTWAREANCQVNIENNRMKIFEQRSLSVFQMTWSHGYDNVTVWDAWNKRHIDLD
jgi:hypothetical protein